MDNVEIIKTFVKIGTLKFGKFTLKSGATSPIYVDMRVIISDPVLLEDLSCNMWKQLSGSQITPDIICGVPYTALPIATVTSMKFNVPMVMKRKEAKDYGTQKMVEGSFNKGDRCLIIEDVVTTGQSVVETAELLRKEGMDVTDCFVVLDRQQGAIVNLERNGIAMHALFKMQDVIDIVSEHNLIPSSLVQEIKLYFEENKVIEIKDRKEQKLPFDKRANLVMNPILKKLFGIMHEKQTNLCIAADMRKSSELLQLGDVLGPYICILKIHVDILEDFSANLPKNLKVLAEKHNFLIMEDRKFADIGNTVKQQYKYGIYKIQEWADIVTVHSIPGEGVVQGLKACSDGKAGVLVAQMSSAGALTGKTYTASTVEIAEKHNDFILGFISQTQVSKKTDFIHMCPGISISTSKDTLGQQYRSPEEAIKQDGVDIIIVGRGITGAENVVESAKFYQARGFAAYMDMI